MKIFWLSIQNMVSRPLGTTLSLLLLTLGVGLISLILHIEHHIQDQMSKNIRGIDMVLGAKGSPLQLILSAVYQIDAPTGNISLSEAETLIENGLIEFGIPLSYGDNHEGYRIVGSDHRYPEHYNASIENGRLWEKPFEVTLGSKVAENLGLKIGDEFSGAHGLTSDGDIHEESAYQVVGILSTSNSVIDQLILCSTESVWEIHHHEEKGEHDEHGEEGGHDEHHHDEVTEHNEGEEDREITAMLVGFRNPMGIVQIPRMVNENTSMQAAVPVYEIDRLFGIMGVSIEVLNAIAMIIVFVSGMSIFISLYSALKDRRYEMALMRTYGASRWQLLWVVLQEGLLLSIIGLLLGLIASRVGLFSISRFMEFNYHYSLTGMGWVSKEWWLLTIAICIGLLASLIPAIQAFNINISKTLGDA